MRETAIQAKVRAVLNRIDTGVRVWRNNVGEWKTPTGQYVKYGLAPGSADLVGIAQVVIRPEDVGASLGRFLAVEVKTPTGRLSDEQRAWLATVEKLGGLTAVTRTEAEAVELLRRLRHGS